MKAILCHVIFIFFLVPLLLIIVGIPVQTNNIQQSYDAKNIEALLNEAKDWARDLVYITRTPKQLGRSDQTEILPFALFPSPIPRKMYEKALAVQKAMSLLYFRISNDFDFLKMAYKDVIKSDDSNRILMELLEEIKNEGIKQPISIFLQRSDYMITMKTDLQSRSNEPIYELKQIEVNGGPVGTAGCVERLTQLHRRILEKAKYPDQLINKVLPENRSGSAIAEIIFKAWKLFGDPRAIILFVVFKDPSAFHFTKRDTEYKLEELSGGYVKVVQLTVKECYENLKFDENTSTLWLDGRPIGVVYWNLIRIGSSFDQKSLSVIRMIERSTAIKSVSLFFEMSISKKIQQLLAMPGMVEKFFKDPNEQQMVADIRSTFAKLWGLEKDDEETREVIKDAIAHPERYVLKQNKEGGEGNIWDQQIAKKLQTISQNERAEYILMERLNPITAKNYMVWPFKKVVLDDIVTELGIYGYILGNTETGEVLHYEQPGNMVRTKNKHNNEGGVSSGNGVLDTPFLY